ncbi:conserved hypothetical protein [Candidatus Methylobacter favarea]|uniref:Uncharacterized protein n=1 Tax=Candidatus Methylobacter favarea TaxID=2707345 RepID=A0A8S0WLP9_9GAMM|nr:DUF6157 family protein [Candidatus Methylobacter favarea]CAA9892770.1 conserved hypothetical protein [Candidatus Methylobacter favarea]
MKTTNYYNTFIEVAEDCPVKVAEVPPRKGEAPTVASMQFELLNGNPYKYTSDDVLFQVHAIRNNIARKNYARIREEFFAKGQPCFRSSPLAKRYGWGVHSDAEGRIAIFSIESKEYATLAKDKNFKHLKAMRSKHA